MIVVMGTDDVDLVASDADVLQVGSRNMQNYRLLEAVGQCGKPVLLKRGASATMDEFLLAVGVDRKQRSLEIASSEAYATLETVKRCR